MSSSKEMGPSTSPGVRKSVRLNNQYTPSPLRRSDRGKKFIPSSSSGQKQSAKTQVELDSVARKSVTSHARRNPFKKQRIQEKESDIDGIIERPEKMSVSSLALDNGVNVTPDGDDLKDSWTNLEPESSTCLGSGSETSPPISKGENDTASAICDLCSKRKRVSSGSLDNEYCSCDSNGDVNIDKNVGSFSTSKDIDDHGASVTIASARECDSRNLIEEPHSDDLMAGDENACFDCSDDCDLICCVGKSSKRKTPQQKDLTTPSPRNRKRKQFFDKSLSKPDKENDDVRKKHRKMVNEITDTPSVQIELDEHQATPVPSSEGGDSTNLTCNEVQSSKKNGVTSLNSLNAISNESSIAAEADDVGTKPKGAVNEITGAPSMQIEGGDSMTITCNEVQSLQENGATSDNNLNGISNESSIAVEADALNPDCSENTIDPVRHCPLTEEDNMESSSVKLECSPPASDTPEVEIQKIAPRDEVGMSAIDYLIIEIQQMCYKRQKKLQHKQNEKIVEFHKIWDEKKRKLEEAHLLESAFIRYLYDDKGSVREEKLKGLDDHFANELEQHNLLRDTELKELEAQQMDAMDQEKQKADHWLAEACSSEPRAVNGQQSLCLQHEPRTEIPHDRVLQISAEPPEKNVLVDGNNQISHIVVSETTPADNLIEVPIDKVLQSSAELVVENQQISDIVVSKTAPADTVTDVDSDIHVQDQDAPATANLESSAELQEQNVLVGNQQNLHIIVSETTPADTLTAVESDAPATDDQNPSLAATSELTDTIVNIEPTDHGSVEVEHPNSNETQNSSQTVEAAETGVISNESISQGNDNSEIQSNHLELPISSHNNTTTSPTVISAAELPNQAADSSNLSPLFYDHFQHEFERIVKETECLEKTHQETGSQIATNCEKEMHALRLKYETQLQNARADLRLKQSELEKYKNKCYMNGILGKAFSLKWSACWPCVLPLPGLPQGTSSSFTLQMHQQSAQPLVSLPVGHISFQPSPRSPQIASPSVQTLLHRDPPCSNPTGPATPVTGQIITLVRVPDVTSSFQPSPSPPQIASPSVQTPLHLDPPRSNPTRLTTPVTGQTGQTVMFPLSLQHPASCSSSTPRPPPIISSITPTLNSRISGDVRAPAPHLQPFRQVSATSSTPPHHQPRQMPFHQLPHQQPRQFPFHQSPHQQPRQFPFQRPPHQQPRQFPSHQPPRAQTQPNLPSTSESGPGRF